MVGGQSLLTRLQLANVKMSVLSRYNVDNQRKEEKKHVQEILSLTSSKNTTMWLCNFYNTPISQQTFGRRKSTGVSNNINDVCPSKPRHVQ